MENEDGVTQRSRWFDALFLLAALKGLCGLLVYALGLDPRVGTLILPLPLEVNLFQALVFGAAAFLLVRGGRDDSRAFHLGGFFLLIAGGYPGRFLRQFGADDSLAQAVLHGLGDFRPEFLCPFFFLSFVARFPDTPIPFWAVRALRWAIRLSLWLGTFFVAYSAFIAADSMATTAAAFGPRSTHAVPTWPVDLAWLFFVVTLIFGAAVLTWRGWRASGSERFRGQVFIAALALACGPVTMILLAEILFESYRDQPPNVRAVRLIMGNLFIAAMPLTTAYAVLVHRVLGVRLIARQALQYALAEGSVRLLFWAPFGALCVFVYRHRQRTVAELFSGTGFVVLLLVMAAGVVAHGHRDRILDAVDRKYFRERHRARTLLGQLAEQIRGCHDPLEIANLLTRGIHVALHVERTAVLIVDSTVGQAVDPRGELRPLDPSGRIATLLQSHSEPLVIDPEIHGEILADLPEDERHWLVDARAQLLVPFFTADGALLGLIALGAKEDGLPFLEEDRRLLGEIATATGPVAELVRLKERSTPARSLADTTDAIAVAEVKEVLESKGCECLGCGRVHAPQTETCRRCNDTLTEAQVPYVLRQVFRFDRRIGSGGMAVVYRGTDLKLGRHVAIKTLPRVSSDAALRLHREARAASTVVHPGLASIFGLETWRGTPMLIQEYLAGGTLADRIVRGPQDPTFVLQTGMAVASTLEAIHSKGILHRDVKPSNIGFTPEGVPKLLDFGVARMRHDLRQDLPSHVEGADSQPDWETTWMEIETEAGQVTGTLSYLSPEAINGAEPHPTFDLWSLCVVLYESLIAKNLFPGGLAQVIENIRLAKIPNLRDRLPDCPEALAEFFARELAHDRRRRAQSGRELNRRLGRVLGELGES